MRELKFRAWDKEEERYWFFGLNEILERRMIYRGSFDEKILIGQKEQFTGLKDKNGVEIYEGDIVKVFADRERMYTPKPYSKYDSSKIETRSVIRFHDFKWIVDSKTPFNNNLISPKGAEKEERTLTVLRDLGDYFFFQKNHNNSEWNRSKNNHAYWRSIEVIGNIHQDSYLLDENPKLLEA